MCINQHKRCFLPPTLINLSACKAAPAHSTPPKLVLLLKKRKLFLLRFSTVLNHDMKCYWNKQSYRNQNLNVKLPNNFLGHTHKNQVICFSYLKLCASVNVSVCSRGESYQNISSISKFNERNLTWKHYVHRQVNCNVDSQLRFFFF